MSEPRASRGAGGIRYPLFILFMVLLVASVALLTPWLGIGEGFLIGFDATAALYMVLASWSFGRASPGAWRATAARNDTGRVLLLAIVALLLLVILVVIGLEMGRAGRSNGLAVTLVVLTLAMAWTFGNMVCALHYAHMFYDARPDGSDNAGLNFPGTTTPDFWDFCYFAFVLGMTFQVSDVQIEDAGIRHNATIHALLSFFFNIGVVALTVNVVAGAI